MGRKGRIAMVVIGGVIGAVGLGGLLLSSPSHQACNSTLIQVFNERSCAVDNLVWTPTYRPRQRPP